MANDFKRGIRVYLETSDYGKGIDAMVAATKKYETELAELTKESKKMTAEGKNSGKAWDDLNKKITAHEKQLTKSKTAEADYRAKLQQTEKVLKNLSGVSYDELIEVQKRLQKETRKTDRDLDLHKLRLSQLDRVNKEVSKAQSEMNTHIGQSGNFMSRTANGFNKYFAVVTAGLAAITGLTLGLKKFMDMRMELEDSQANLKALTGLGKEDVDWLTNYAKQLSTTTTELGIRITASSKEIMDGFTVIGSKRPELLKNKEAMAAVTKEALILAAAGKMDVAVAFDVVTAAMNQFNLEAEDSGRIINVIAAGSLEGSAEADSLAGSLKNVGTVADDSNMTLEQTVATLEVLASKQLVGEEAGTKLRGALLKMKDAGVGYVSGAFNMRDAIVEINKKMAEKTSAAERDALLQKVFGAENVTAGTILLKNVEAYDKLTIAVTGTNVATKQAQTNTETVSAKLAQARNNFNELGMSLVEGLNPAMLSATNFANNFLKVLVKMPAWLKENWQWLAALGISITAYTISTKASVIATQANIFWTKIQTAWTNRAATAQSILNFVINKNPIALLVTVIAGLVAGFISWYNASIKVQAVTQGLFASMKVIGGKILAYWTGLWQLVSGAVTLNPKQLKKSIDSFKKAFTGWGDDVAKAYTEAYNQRMAQGIKATPVKPNGKKSQKKEIPENSEITPGGSTGDNGDLFDKELKRKENAYKESQLELMELRRKGEMTEEIYNKVALQTQLLFLEEKKKLQQDFKKDTIDNEIEISNQKLKIQQDADAAILKVTKDNMESGNAALESAFQTKQSMLQDALNRQVITEKEYNSEIKKLVVEQIAARVALAEASLQSLKVANFSDNTVKNNAIGQAEGELIKLKGELTKAQGDVAKDTAKTVEKETLTIAERMEGIFGKSFSNIGNLFAAFKGLGKKNLDGSLKDWKDWANDIGAVVQAGLAVAQEVSDQYFEYKAAELEADKQRELTNAGDSAEAREAINQKYAQKELDLKKKQSSADTFLKVAQAVAAGGLAVVQAFAQLGPIGGAIAAVLIGGITGLQVGTILKQNAAIQATTLDSSATGGDSAPPLTGARVVTTPQAASGRWDVIGEEDGKLYRNVPYTGVARTGIISSPTLVGEEPEIVIDNPTTRNIIMNAPWLLGEIKKYRVPQRASGKYDAIGNSPAGGTSAVVQDNSAMMLAALDRMIALLQYLIDNGVKAPIVLSELEAAIALRDKSLKKGSLK